jgi:hypothetical protein
MNGYDIVGDIHGCADLLAALLVRLGYREQDGCFRHPRRQALLVGDFIDRGAQNFQTLRIVKAMVEGGAARAVMGNHEYNALCYHTRDETGTFLREHSEKNTSQHRRVLEEIRRRGQQEWLEYLSWLKSLPLFLELDGLRLVHACWDEEKIRCLKGQGDVNPSMSDDFLRRSADKGTAEFAAVDMVLKGREVDLPDGISYEDKDGHLRRRVRVRWWMRPSELKEARSFADITRAPPEVLNRLRDFKLPPKKDLHLAGYGEREVPVFFGHYWFTGRPQILSANSLCLDYSAVLGGHLCAYRWHGESRLDAQNLVYV